MNLRDRRGISPVITTVIIVAVGIAVAIAVALWMSGLVGVFTRFEKVEIRNSYASLVGSNFVVKITFMNTGSTDTTIDTILVNGKLHSDWTTVSPDLVLPITLPVGNNKTLTLLITNPATAGQSKLVSGVTVTVGLHSSGGKEYSTSVTLP